MARIYHPDKYNLNSDKNFTEEEGSESFKNISNTFEDLQHLNFIT